MNSVDISGCRSAEDMLSENARQAECLREQICQLRRQQIDRILKLFDECRRVDKSLTLQTAELKSHVERIQQQIDELHRFRQDGGQLGRDKAESIAANEHLHPENERPLSKMLGKLLTPPDSEDGRVLRTITRNTSICQKYSQGPVQGSEQATGSKRKTGPLDSEELRKVAELGRRLAHNSVQQALRPGMSLKNCNSR